MTEKNQMINEKQKITRTRSGETRRRAGEMRERADEMGGRAGKSRARAWAGFLLASLLLPGLFSCYNRKAIQFGDPGFLLTGSHRLSVYYNDPGTDHFTGTDKKIDLELIKLMEDAETSVDMAVYNLSRASIIEALENAERRDIRVRMVGDVDEVVTDGYRSILRTDIPFSLGNTSAIQHNKFAVIDNKYVFMGTGNMTDSGFLRNNNNYLIIESESLAGVYTKEFEQMFYGRYGAKKAPFTSNFNHQVDFTPMEIYFSPYNGQDAMDRIIKLVNEARHEIQYMIFAFTHDELDTALIRAARRGVLVRGIHDSTFIRGVSEEAPRLYSAGLNIPTGPFVREDGNEHTAIMGVSSHGGKLHTKSIIIDGQIVCTGSFNWSTNAVENNDENMLVVHSALVAHELQQQWEKAWEISKPISNQLRHPSGDAANYGDVVISEIMWAGSYGTGDTSPNSTDDWIELYNTTDHDIDISHWGITWDSSENKIYPLPDEYNWYQPGVATRHQYRGRLIIPAKGYFLLKSQNESIETEDNKISGTKSFDLNTSSLHVRLYDVTMNLIDEAGNGDPPFAGKIDNVNKRVYSMERFFYPADHPQAGKPLPGASPGSWYTSNGNGKTGISGTCDVTRVCGTGQIGDDYKQGTIATPNYSGNSSSPATASRASGGIHQHLNTPVAAYSTGTNEAVIQMRWALIDTPRVDSITICGGVDCPSVRLDPTDSSRIIVQTLGQTPGAHYTLKVYGGGAGDTSKIDVTGGYIYGGIVGFEGHGNDRARMLVTKVAPAITGSEDYIELTAQSSGTLYNLGIYYYDFFSPTPILLYRMADVPIAQGQKVLLTLDKPLTKSDDRLAVDQCVIGTLPSDDCYAVTTATYDIDNGTAGQWDVYSSVPGIISSDGIIFASYDLAGNPEDMMCYSNRDGDIPEGLMTGGFRTMYRFPSSVFNLNVFPVDGYNDFEVQSQCSDFAGGTGGAYLIRTGNAKTGADFTCPDC